MVGIVLGCECDQLREGGYGWAVVIEGRRVEEEEKVLYGRLGMFLGI